MRFLYYVSAVGGLIASCKAAVIIWPVDSLLSVVMIMNGIGSMFFLIQEGLNRRGATTHD